MASTSQAPLALPSAGHAAGWRRDQHLVDALPYIDSINQQEKAEVEALIAEECARSKKRPSDYLQELPPLPPLKFDGHPVLQSEWERVKNKQPMPKPDTSRYRLDPPPQTRRHDVGAWKTALDNAYSQLEHQANRIQNLELLLKYGDKGWRAQTQLQEATLKQLEADLADTRKSITNLNQERKLSQMAAGNELRQLQQEYLSLVAKNLEIEGACDAVQLEIDTLQARLGGPEQGATQGAGEQPASGSAGAMDVDGQPGRESGEAAVGLSNGVHDQSGDGSEQPNGA